MGSDQAEARNRAPSCLAAATRPLSPAVFPCEGTPVVAVWLSPPSAAQTGGAAGSDAKLAPTEGREGLREHPFGKLMKLTN